MSLKVRLQQIIPERHPVRLFWHWCKALIAAIRCGFPARRLTIIGITGTDGKTTTVAMTAHILHAAGIPTGAVSTSFFFIRGKTEENPTHKTSLTPMALQQFLRRCVREGCTTVVVECSSHGLVQHRVDFLWPTVAAITNTSPEHLDYHGTMEQYRKDKGILFGMLRGRGVKVLNVEDDTYQIYSGISLAKTITYSAKVESGKWKVESSVHLWLTDQAAKNTSSDALIHCLEKNDHSQKESEYRLHLNIPGTFNLENALCAVGCASASGISAEKAVQSLKDFSGVPGRMERIDEGQPFDIYVDFTVSPAAYEKTLSAIRKTLAPSKRLLVLTGSCGNRMPEKRPMIGKIVGEMAEVVVVSEDETVTEDTLKIIDEVWAGIDQSKTDAHKIIDRREAIRFLFKIAQPGDAVALCGMGACTTMQTKEGLRPWDEREVARKLLREIKR